MKIDKNTVLIVLIVAVLGFFLWKSSAAKKGQVSTEAAPQMPSVDKNRVYSIVGALGLDTATKETVTKQANWAISCYNNPSRTATQTDWVTGIARSAKASDITFEQQAVIEGLWVAFMGDNAILKDEDSFERYRSMVLSM